MVTKVETSALSEPAVEAFPRLDDAREAWRELFACAPASPYQSYDYVSAWLETLGAGSRLAPMIVVARGGDGRPEALVPLAVREFAGFRVAEFLCGRESNFNLALTRPGAGLNLRDLLVSAARGQARPPDLFYLRNQPRSFADFENPMIGPDARPSPSFAYASRLPASAAALEERFSKDAHKKLRSKTRRLSSLGSLAFEHDARSARRDEIIRALATQKAARLATMGVAGFNADVARAFLSAVADCGLLEVHGLSVSGRVVAAYVGLVDRGRFCGLFNSFDMEPEIARLSPCDILLHALLQNLVARGFSHFDLGVGEARYKSAVCEETIALYDSIIPVTTRGALAAPLFRKFIDAKRAIKQTPALARALEKIRRLVV
ncbi:GNAT family N-acetyltransferase [Methylocystis heyeri]|uniref:GNAT family N-acetyltransferase n=1 Tax=Methylocystis heyeri TaxID=391905 RepID=A0A6B8KBA0_9HYPH|nr:GNAT family N-acetyltransferase [Methylocystis heyeri]QGM44812.1 GNAT family N-acetyltransferase [Methylocystis heyeri]